jgi:hypothetical protein
MTSCSPYVVPWPRSTPARSLPAVVSRRCRAAGCRPTHRSAGTLPGRVAVRTDSPEVVPVARGHVSGTSVFDNLPPVEQPPTNDEAADTVAADDDAGDGHRTSALRRLIGSLRRR